MAALNRLSGVSIVDLNTGGVTFRIDYHVYRFVASLYWLNGLHLDGGQPHVEYISVISNILSMEWKDRFEQMDDLTGFQRDLLYVVAGFEEPHGLALKAELETYYEQEINHGRLYPNLDELVEKGLLAKGEIDDRTNMYTLTNRGQREIEARRTWEAQYLEDEQAATTS